MQKKFYSLAATLIIAFTALTSTDLKAAFVCGDADGSESVTISDAVYLINYIFGGGPEPSSQLAADADGSELLNISDVVFLINYIFGGGPEPRCLLYSAPPTTTIIPDDDTTSIIDYDTTSGTLTLAESSVYAQELEVGDVAIGQDSVVAPYGFLRKVTTKSVQGNSIIIETEPATMTEAFQHMDISEIHPLLPSDVESYSLNEGVRYLPERDGETFNVGLDVVLHDQDGDFGTTEDQIKLSGNYAFTASLFADIEISWFTLQRFETGIETGQVVNLELMGGIEWGSPVELTYDLAEFHLAPIPVGGVVWLVPTLTLEASIHGDLSVTFETGIEYTQQLRCGLGWANDEYYTISETSQNFAYTPPQFNAEFNFEPAISLNASLLLYGVAGPYLGGKGGFHFQSALGADPCNVELSFSLDAILYASVGIQCNIVGRFGLDYSHDWQLYTLPIGEWIYPLNGSGTIVIDPDPNSINAPWSLVGPCSYSSDGGGDQTLTSLDPGEYTVTWGAVSGWTTPSNLTQNLTAGNTLTLSGTYVANNTIPVLTTAAVSAITQTTAQSGGNITSDGGAAVTARGVCWSTNATPTIADSKTTDGTGTGSFTSAITGLTAGTDYYVRAYATNSAGTGYGSAQPFTTTGAPGTVTDIDGNVYQTVTIGSQVWMAENLKVTHYRTGDPIPNVTTNSEWFYLVTGAYCDYDNNPANVATYGRLYNWYAVVDNRNIAPAGWHVPTDAEWKQLEMYLGLSQTEADDRGMRGTNEGGKLKEAGTTHWNSPNTGATNESGFSALPGGYRQGNGLFYRLGDLANFWSSSVFETYWAWYRQLQYNYSSVGRDYHYNHQGFSVRCVRD